MTVFCTLNLGSLSITDTDAALTLGSVDASIVATDILGTNGVIHVIDEVMSIRLWNEVKKEEELLEFDF